MFLGSNYVNGNELAIVANMNVSNISQTHSTLVNEMYNNVATIKTGRVIFLNKTAKVFNPNFTFHLNNHNFVDFSNMVIQSKVYDELNINKKELEELIKNNDDFISVEIHFGKKFVRFSDSFVEMFKGKQYYAMSQLEADDLLVDEFDLIYDLTSEKCLVIYTV